MFPNFSTVRECIYKNLVGTGLLQVWQLAYKDKELAFLDCLSDEMRMG